MDVRFNNRSQLAFAASGIFPGNVEWIILALEWPTPIIVTREMSSMN
jgi:hypothetical protein